jgi:tagatose-6-phosphate ketose/aldose isomerase
MTSSFSGMLLAATLAFDLAVSNAADSAPLAGWATQVLGAGLSIAKRLADSEFTRVVYLGSNECKGLAREAALKMLELSDGQVVATSETPLGFRHGPKTIVNANTLVIMFLSNNPYTRRYELDLLNELHTDGVAARIIVLTSDGQHVPDQSDTISVSGASLASDLGLCFPYVVFAQTLAFLRSLALGLRPDAPNTIGTVNRVVQGVSIYPWRTAG